MEIGPDRLVAAGVAAARSNVTVINDIGVREPPPLPRPPLQAALFSRLFLPSFLTSASSPVRINLARAFSLRSGCRYRAIRDAKILAAIFIYESRAAIANISTFQKNVISGKRAGGCSWMGMFALDCEALKLCTSFLVLNCVRDIMERMTGA